MIGVESDVMKKRTRIPRILRVLRLRERPRRPAVVGAFAGRRRCLLPSNRCWFFLVALAVSLPMVRSVAAASPSIASPSVSRPASSPLADASIDRSATETLRLVSLAPSLTETLFALGYGAQVVAVTDYCRHPPEAAARPRVGGLYDVNVERILVARPDVVFHVPHHTEVGRRLERAGIRAVNVPSETVADVLTGIRLVGEQLRAEPRAEALVASIERDLRAAAARAATLPPRRFLLVVDHEPASIRGMYAAGEGNYLDEVLSRLGGVNVLRGTDVAYPKLSPEVLLRDPPDVLLDSKYVEAGQTRGDWEPVMRREWERLFAASGARRPRIEFIVEPRTMLPGPSIRAALPVLARHLHGEAWDRAASPPPPPLDGAFPPATEEAPAESETTP